jgi:hypothetical protein
MTTYNLEITFWNKDNDETLTQSLLTSYPSYEDVEETMDMNGMSDKLKTYGGEYDFFEITKKYLVD